ncbi:hypothetical protein Ocin01_06723, partial [Orchesella cincta]
MKGRFVYSVVNDLDSNSGPDLHSEVDILDEILEENLEDLGVTDEGVTKQTNMSYVYCTYNFTGYIDRRRSQRQANSKLNNSATTENEDKTTAQKDNSTTGKTPTKNTDSQKMNRRKNSEKTEEPDSKAVESISDSEPMDTSSGDRKADLSDGENSRSHSNKESDSKGQKGSEGSHNNSKQQHDSGSKSRSKDPPRAKEDDNYDTRSEVSSSDDENHSQISNPSLSSGSFKSGS